jgi:uncharacterized protein (TIGR00369 family)
MNGQAPALEDLLLVLQGVYEEKLPFNRVLGFRVVRLTDSAVRVGVSMRPDLIGNFVAGTLHGGVISAVLDATGGLMASVSVLKRLQEETPAAIEGALARVGTIDLRVDFLRPGKGERFTADAVLMRAGNKVAVTRMEFHNDKKVLIAVGTGTYLVG